MKILIFFILLQVFVNSQKLAVTDELSSFDPAFYQCCIDKSMPKECADPLCTYSNLFTNRSIEVVGTLYNCINHWDTLISCVIDQRDDYDCCISQSVDASCLSLCSGKVNISDVSSLKCVMTQMSSIGDCVYNGLVNIPKAPTDLRITILQQYSATIEWSMSDSSPQIYEYTVFIRHPNNQLFEYSVVSQSQNNSYTFKDLIPSMGYTVYVIGKNQNGSSLKSNMLTFNTPLLNQIEQCSNVYCTLTPSNLLDNEKANCIDYLQSMTAEINNKMLQCNIDSNVMPSFIYLGPSHISALNKLAGNDQYNCQSNLVKSINCANKYYVNSIADLSDLKVGFINDTSASISWSSMDSSSSDTIYTLYLRLQSSMSQSYERLTTTVTNMQLVELLPDEVYEAYLIAESVYFIGVSNVIEFSTLESPKASQLSENLASLMKPLNPHVSDITDSSVILRWNPVVGPTPVTDYQVMLYLEKSDGNYVQKSFSTATNQIEIDSLETGKTYRFTVKSLYYAGESNVSDEVSFTLPITVLFGTILHAPDGPAAFGASIRLTCECSNANFVINQLNYLWIDAFTNEPIGTENIIDFKVNKKTTTHLMCVISVMDNTDIKPLTIAYQINPQFKPEIQGILTKHNFTLNETTEFTSEIKGLPDTIKWFKLQEYFEKNNLIVTLGNTPAIEMKPMDMKYEIQNTYDSDRQVNRTKLIIYKADQIDIGVYKCEASNKLGVEVSFHLLLNEAIQSTPDTMHITKDCCKAENVNDECTSACGSHIPLSATVTGNDQCIADMGIIAKCVTGGQDYKACCSYSITANDTDCLAMCAGERLDVNLAQKCFKYLNILKKCEEDLNTRVPKQALRFTLTVLRNTVLLLWIPSNTPGIDYHEINVFKIHQNVTKKLMYFTTIPTSTSAYFQVLNDVSSYYATIKSVNKYGQSLTLKSNVDTHMPDQNEPQVDGNTVNDGNESRNSDRGNKSLTQTELIAIVLATFSCVALFVIIIFIAYHKKCRLNGSDDDTITKTSQAPFPYYLNRTSTSIDMFESVYSIDPFAAMTLDTDKQSNRQLFGKRLDRGSKSDLELI